MEGENLTTTTRTVAKEALRPGLRRVRMAGKKRKRKTIVGGIVHKGTHPGGVSRANIARLKKAIRTGKVRAARTTEAGTTREQKARADFKRQKEGLKDFLPPPVKKKKKKKR
jgi:hypothetical protein